jgi:hypothetical protein
MRTKKPAVLSLKIFWEWLIPRGGSIVIGVSEIANGFSWDGLLRAMRDLRY